MRREHTCVTDPPIRVKLINDSQSKGKGHQRVTRPVRGRSLTHAQLDKGIQYNKRMAQILLESMDSEVVEGHTRP